VTSFINLEYKFVGLYLRNYKAHGQSEKNLFNSGISPTCPHTLVNFGPLTAEIGSGVWGTPANFNGQGGHHVGQWH